MMTQSLTPAADRRLLLPPGASSRTSAGKPDFARWLDFAPRVLQAFGLVGLGLYAVVRFGYDSFYSRLQVSPDEVGITQMTVISQAALGLFFVGPLIVLCIVVLALLIALLIAVLWWSTAKLFGTRFSISPAHVPPGMATESRVWKLMSILQGRLSEPVRPVVVTALLVVPLVYLGYVHWFHDGNEAYTRAELAALVIMTGACVPSVVTIAFWFFAKLQQERIIRLLAAFAALVSISAAGVSLVLIAGEYGSDIAGEVIKGQENRPDLGDLLQFRADRVCAVWMGSDPHPGISLDMPLLYLGQSGSEMVLYRPEPSERMKGIAGATDSGPIRIPASRVTLKPARAGRDTRC